MKYISYNNEMKALNSKEYMEYINSMGAMGSVNHAVHAEPKWNTGNTNAKGDVEHKKQTSSNKSQMPQISAHKVSKGNEKPVIEEKGEQTMLKSDTTKHVDCMSGINKVNMVIMGPAYFYMHAEPITEYNFRQAQIVGTRKAIKEAALLGLLIGMGFDHEQAYMIVDKWKGSEPL
jgi:hypothetical protein